MRKSRREVTRRFGQQLPISGMSRRDKHQSLSPCVTNGEHFGPAVLRRIQQPWLSSFGRYQTSDALSNHRVRHSGSKFHLTELNAGLCRALLPLHDAPRLPGNFSTMKEGRSEVVLFPGAHCSDLCVPRSKRKTLCKILRLLWPCPLSPHEAINGAPIGAAKAFKGLLRRWRFTLRLEHDAPMRGGENRAAVISISATRGD